MTENSGFNKFFILIGLIALFVIPELNNVHYDPQPQFWAEATVAWAILGLFTFILIRIKQIYIPSIVIPLSLFAIYLILQQYIVLIEFPGLSYATAIELLFCIFIAITISTINARFGLKFLVTAISYILLYGALLQSLIGLIQYTGTAHYFGDMIFYDSSHPTTNIFGHFGQRNHYAHYLSWASFGIIYLYQERKIGAKLFYPIIIWFSFSLTIAASRSVFIYFALALIISAISWAYTRCKNQQKLFGLILITTIILLACEYFYPLIHQLITNHHNFSSGLERLDSSSGTDRRFAEWVKAWLVFKNYPIFGFGWNEYAKESVALYLSVPKTPLNSGLFTNCHNLILQLLADTGLIGTLIVVGGIALTIYRIICGQKSVEKIILLCMAGTTLSHSMNEYPLWYMYFLAGLIVFISVDKPIAKISVNIVRTIGTVPIIICGYLLINGSIIFNTLVDYYDAPDNSQDFNKQAKYLQNLVDHNSLWSYYAIYTLDNYINVDNKLTNQLYPVKTQYQYTQKFGNFHPYPDTLLKEGMLAWNLGDKSRAESLVSTAVIAFPVYYVTYRNTLKAKKYKPLYELIPAK